MSYTPESRLCSVCKAALQRPNSGQATELDTGFFKHHLHAKSLLQAIEQNCYICTIAWENSTSTHGFDETGRNLVAELLSATPDSFNSSYRIQYEDKGNNTQLLKLEIFIDYADLSSHTNFRLVPCDGQKFKHMFPICRKEDSTSSPSTLDLAYNWWLSCCSNHTRCNYTNGPSYAKQGWLPTRLLDIGACYSQVWKLIVTKTTPLPSPIPPYITLSYRWGLKPQKLMLLTSTLGELIQGRRIQDLPLTFNHLVVVARRFSIRYLWIDALCIIQDSKEDWEAEVLNMRFVYANSACNVAATASDSPDGGLFRDRDPARMFAGRVMAPFLDPSRSFTDHFIFDKSYWDRRLFCGPLHKRGWAFQERLLAPRVLYFTDDQIMWECQEEAKCEGFPQGIPYHRSPKNFDALWQILDLYPEALVDFHGALEFKTINTVVSPLLRLGNSIRWGSFGKKLARVFFPGVRRKSESEMPQGDKYNYSWGEEDSLNSSSARPPVSKNPFCGDIKVSSVWEQLVRDFTQCALTKPSDKLVAFLGIARLFYDITGDDYLAGLWRSRFLEQMDWRVEEPRSRLSDEYRAPSWSWASIDGPVRPQGEVIGMNILVTLEDVAVEHENRKLSRRILSGYAKLKGVVLEVRVDSCGVYCSCRLSLGGCQVEAEFFPDCKQEFLSQGQRLWCMPFKICPQYEEQQRTYILTYLVLSPVSGTLTATYRRIGQLLVHSSTHVCSLSLCLAVDEDGELGWYREIPGELVTIL